MSDILRGTSGGMRIVEGGDNKYEKVVLHAAFRILGRPLRIFIVDHETVGV